MMGYPGSTKWTARPAMALVLRYGLAVSLVAAALGTSLIQRHYNSLPRFISHYTLVAIAITFWYAGSGPGLLAFFISCLGSSLLARNHFLAPDFPLGSFVVLYAIFSLLVGWFSAVRRRTERLLTEARDNLELRVAERTGDLVRANDKLQDTQAELVESKARLEEAECVAHVGYWEWNLTSNRVIWSDETYRIYGMQPQERPMDLAAIREFIHPEDRDFVFRGAEEAIRSGGRPDVEYRIIRPSGEVRIIHSLGDVKRDASGQPYQMFGMTQDISDRKRAEEALHRSEAYLAEAQRLSHTGSWVCNVADRSAIYLSEECYRVFGWDPTDGPPPLEKWVERIHPEDRLKWEGAVERAIQEKADFEQEFRIVLPDGIVRWINAVGHPVLTAAGTLVQFIGSSTDITERKRAEEERERLHQLEADLAHINRVSMMGELAASLAHEIKQPITAAVTNAEACLHWIARDQPDLVEAHEAATETVNEARRAADIITRIRSLFQKEQPRREPLDINEVISEMVSIVREEARRHSISLRTLLCSTLPRVSADRVQLEQVLMNLMLNGIEAMRAMTGELTIKTQRDEHGGVLISVSDIGVGLPAENVAKIFDAFFTTKPQGTGMGLAISRSIVESHGGRIWATANAEKGTTFHCTLPNEIEASA
jgi:PAS domain S-box-containing protein